MAWTAALATSQNTPWFQLEVSREASFGGACPQRMERCIGRDDRIVIRLVMFMCVVTTGNPLITRRPIIHRQRCVHFCSLALPVLPFPASPRCSSRLNFLSASLTILSASPMMSLPTLHPRSITPCSERTCSACAHLCRHNCSFFVPYCSPAAPPRVLPVLVRLMPCRGAAVENG